MLEAALWIYGIGVVLCAIGFGFVTKEPDRSEMWAGLAISLLWPAAFAFACLAALGGVLAGRD